MVIRPARSEDHARLLAVWWAASRVGHPFVGEAWLAEEARLVREVYLAKAETWVAETDGRIQGYLGLLGQEMGGLFVDPAVHRQGVGRRLLDHARSLKGALTVEVFARNPVAPAFYRACGFQVVGRRAAGETGLPDDLLLLRLPAPGP